MSVALAELPDLVVLDIAMPTADGRRHLASPEADDARAGSPSSSTRAQQPGRQDFRVRFFGADDYFDKLYDLTLLFRARPTTSRGQGRAPTSSDESPRWPTPTVTRGPLRAVAR